MGATAIWPSLPSSIGERSRPIEPKVLPLRLAILIASESPVLLEGVSRDGGHLTLSLTTQPGKDRGIAPSNGGMIIKIYKWTRGCYQGIPPMFIHRYSIYNHDPPTLGWSLETFCPHATILVTSYVVYLHQGGSGMIKVTVELYPFGNESRKRVLCTGKIWNDGTGSKTSGNYRYRLMCVGGSRMWREGSVKGFPRKRKSVWWLLAKCLLDAVRG